MSVVVKSVVTITSEEWGEDGRTRRFVERLNETMVAVVGSISRLRVEVPPAGRYADGSGKPSRKIVGHFIVTRG